MIEGLEEDGMDERNERRNVRNRNVRMTAEAHPYTHTHDHRPTNPPGMPRVSAWWKFRMQFAWFEAESAGSPSHGSVFGGGGQGEDEPRKKIGREYFSAL